MKLENLYYESISNNEIILWYYDVEEGENIGVTLFSETGVYNCAEGVQILQEYKEKVKSLGI